MGKPKPTERGAKRDDADEGLSQAERFKRTARELGADESEERFKERLRKIAKAPLPKGDQPPKGCGTEGDDETSR